MKRNKDKGETKARTAGKLKRKQDSEEELHKERTRNCINIKNKRNEE